MLTWSAKNYSTYLQGSRKAPTLRSAVLAARSYLKNELYGEGTITYFKNGKPFRRDERSIFTGFKMVTTKI